MDLTITVPKQQFFDWRPHLDQREDRQFYFRIPYLPLKMKEAKRCYVIYKGNIVGFFFVTAFIEIKCTHNGLSKGYYLLLDATKWKSLKQIPAKSHRGFKYIENTDHVATGFTNMLDKMEELFSL